ncbi:hypothetical protein POTOM_028259 [Populus tomentosa]|uniref:Uncharacterized protein n=1 Tax=Populus tomentosa TaxID=118781 RepID=A0A8X7ZPU1_POPTO|nr:hypothetical protein POTOM_028259 [Populus tomentosa]
MEVKDPLAVAREVQEADREKLRKDNPYEQFLELLYYYLNSHFRGIRDVHPDRPKNDKSTVLTDVIQVLKDLTSKVDRLQVQCATLSGESCELMQEKNELREERASLKAEIENLNAQYRQKARAMFPWAAVDPTVVMPPPYSHPVPVPVPPGPIHIHPSLQPFVFFGNQNPGAIASPCFSIYSSGSHFQANRIQEAS